MIELRARIAALAVGAVCAGCGGSPREVELVHAGGFQLVDMSVEEGELAWPINRPIHFRFNLPIDFSTVGHNTISIRQQSGIPATGAFTRAIDPVTGEVDPASVVFQPACPREPSPFPDAGLQANGTWYELRVLGRESGLTVLSLDGRQLTTGQTRMFRTPFGVLARQVFHDPVPGAPRVLVRGVNGVSLAATTASRVELGPEREQLYFEGGPLASGALPSTLPLNLYSRPDTHWSVVVEFDQPIDVSPASVSAETIKLQFQDPSGEWRASAARVDVESNCTQSGASVRLIPEGPLPAGSEVRVVVTNGLRDLRGESAQAGQVAPLALRTDGVEGGPQNDASFEDFLVGGGGALSFEDVTTVFAEGRASWADGKCKATLQFEGTGGPGGGFDVVVPAGEIVTFDTLLQTVESQDSTQQTQFSGGQVDVRHFRVETGAVLRVIGPNPFVLRATGDIVIDGTIDVSGLNAADVVGLGLANIPHGGAAGLAGSGAGGVGSPDTLGSSRRGGAGAGAFGRAGLGGGGGESGYSGSQDENLRRAGGGGGGVFGANILTDVPADDGSGGLAAQPGFAGMDTSPFDPNEYPNLTGPNTGAFGAESGSLGPRGGAVGTSPFTDSSSTNDFWGRRNDPDGGVTLGELPSVWAGSGGGAGGDAIPSAFFPNPGFVAPNSADERGGSGGSGGGSLHLMSIGDIRFGPAGRVVGNGGDGGRGESTSGFDNIAGGGGGGSGGHIVLETNGFVDFTEVQSGLAPLAARGGRGGSGIPILEGTLFVDVLGYPVNRGGDGGPGVIQVHVPGATLEEQHARIRLPSGASLESLSRPDALVLVPSFGSRSRAQSRWIALGGASPASGSGGDPVRFRFAGTSPGDGALLDSDGDSFVDALAPLVQGTTVGVEPPTSSVAISTAGWVGAELEPLATNPVLLRGFELRVGGAAFEIMAAAADPLDGTVELELAGPSASLAKVVADEPYSLVPRYFRISTQGVPDRLPASATVRIEFQATGLDGSGAPDEGALLVDWTGDIEELNRPDLPAPIAFFRYRVLFDVDAHGAGLDSGLALPELEFVSVPFQFGQVE